MRTSNKQWHERVVITVENGETVDAHHASEIAGQTCNDVVAVNNGEMIEAQAPVIISASRSTDVPAFYAEWFIERLRSGYVVWKNPFNQQQMYVSFKNCKVIVFWTKNPKPLMPFLQELDERGIHYYFQFTLNDYEKEGFEPNLPPFGERIETFRELSARIGREKVIWRFDPMIVTPWLSPCELLKRVRETGNLLRNYTDKLVFSFVDIDIYRKVQRNLIRVTSHFSEKTIHRAELTIEQKIEIAEGLKDIRACWKREEWGISLATCTEMVDLEQYGIQHNRCIDGELMKRLFQEDTALVHYLNYGTLLNDSSLLPLSVEKMKDKGQRKACGCMVSKDIGMYGTCRHFCVYCYATSVK